MSPKKVDWQTRAEALMQAARDLRRDWPQESVSNHLSASHKDLFARYVVDLRRAKQGAENWWSAMIETETQRTIDQVEAEYNVSTRYQVGAVANRGVIHVLRKYWLSCVALNEELSPKDRVHPEEFLLGALLREHYEDLAEFVSRLPYWPIGLDDEGRWV